MNGFNYPDKINTLKPRKVSLNSLHVMRIAIVLLISMIELKRITLGINGLCYSCGTLTILATHFSITGSETGFSVSQEPKLDCLRINECRCHNPSAK